MENQEKALIALCEKAVQDGNLSQEELRQLFDCPEELNQMVFDAADKVRVKEMGNQVHLRGLIEFSNYCSRNCMYCGLRRDIADLKRYRMEADEIVKCAANAEKLGYRSVVLQAGEDPYYTAEKIAKIVSGIKAATDLAITMSAGEFSYRDYKLMREAGADRYLLRFETADRELYKALHPDSDFDARIECLHVLKDLEYQVGSGFMVGLPGETTDTLVQNILLLEELDVDMAGIGPFIPNPQTPLAGEKGGLLQTSLKAVALARLVLKNIHIPATTAMGSLDRLGRQKALKAGANVVMPNVTPMQYRELYQLYPNKICLTDDPAHCRNCISGIILSLGREVSQEHGHSLKMNCKTTQNKENHDHE